MTNSNILRLVGALVLTGSVGGWIGTKIAQSKAGKDRKALEEEMERKLEDLKKQTSMVLSEEARRAVRSAFDIEARESVIEEVEARVRLVDIKEATDAGVARGINEAITDAKYEINTKAIDQLRFEISKIAHETVEARLTDELYKVNMRRIVEDSVDRAVRDEVRSAVKSKIPSWFSTEDLRRILF